jgi:hypothetical protein
MNRRAFSRGRLLAGIGAIVALVGCLFPWGRTPGVGLPPATTTAFDGISILVFIAAVATLALISLPYAAGDQPIALDRPLSFAVVAAIGVAGLLIRVVQLLSLEVLGLPDRSPGLWLAGLGVALVVWGTAELFTEPARR